MRRLEVTCPACSSGGPVIHEVLSHEKGGGGEEVYIEATVRCGNCGTVHRTDLRIPRPIEVDVVVSRGGESGKEALEMFPDEVVTVGEEIGGLEVTSIETEGGRADEASAGDVETLWTRATDRVEVPVSLHTDGETFSEKVEMDGDEEIEVGQTLRRKGRTFEVASILTGGGKEPRAKAKNVKRVYAVAGEK